MITKKIKIRKIRNDIRFNGGYYLNEDALNSSLLEDNTDKCNTLEELAAVWNPPIFKRQYCEKSEYSVQYCQSSDITNTFEGSNIYVNKLQAEKVGAIVRKDQILITGFGTIGNTRIINEESDGICYANNACRVEAKIDNLSGFLYAFISSKYGRSQLNKNASGSVVRYIEAPGIKKILVPKISDSLKLSIHKLIDNVTRLRADANKLLKSADLQFIDNLNITDKDYDILTHPLESTTAESFIVKKSNINPLSIRSRTYSERLRQIKEHFSSGKNEKLISLLKYPPIKGGRYKRVEVSADSANATELLNQGDLHNLRPQGRIISKKYIDNLDNQTAKRNMIIVPAVGTLGENEIFSKPLLVHGYLENKVLSEHLLRIMPDEEKIPSGYLFTVLRSKLFFRAFRSLVYGTNLLYYILPMLEEMPIPRFSKDIEDEISDKVLLAYDKLTDAIKIEKQAIDLVEKEIEQWEK